MGKPRTVTLSIKWQYKQELLFSPLWAEALVCWIFRFDRLLRSTKNAALALHVDVKIVVRCERGEGPP